MPELNPSKSRQLKRTCSNCDWHEDFTGACCNGDSRYCADFTDDDQTCDVWDNYDLEMWGEETDAPAE